jgi:hypothetical protein
MVCLLLGPVFWAIAYDALGANGAVCVSASSGSTYFTQTLYGCNRPSVCPADQSNPFTNPAYCGLSTVHLDAVLGSDTPTCGSSTSPCGSFSQALVVGTTNAVLFIASGTYTGAANCGQVISNGNYSILGYEAAFSCPKATWLTLSAGANVSVMGVTIMASIRALYISGAFYARFLDCVFTGNTGMIFCLTAKGWALLTLSLRSGCCLCQCWKSQLFELHLREQHRNKCVVFSDTNGRVLTLE